MTVKNDYTFEKTVCNFLGETDEAGKPVENQNKAKISQNYREVMPKIISQTMRQ